MTTSTPSRTADRVDLVLRVLLGLFFVIASALPKLFGEAYAVQIFDEIGAGDWFRYAIGLVELAGGIGLLIPRLAGAAAAGLIGLMVGAAITQAFVLDQPAYVVTPVILGVLLAVIVRHHRVRFSELLRR
jgi:putative oxidoreductase